MHASKLAGRLRLVVVTDVDLAKPRQVIDVVRAAVTAGAPAIQLRDKAANARELLEAGRVLLPVVHGAGALFFINDRVDVALALGADGVHVGPNDIPASAIRAVVPREFIIGGSTDKPAHAQQLVSEGVDYIGCGSVYTTSTKPDAGASIGVEGLQAVVDSVEVPVIGIGGISGDRIAEVARSGAAGVASVGAVMGAADVSDEVVRLLAPWSRG
jgi:thiamine-phosphate pyrophosphorylase